MARTKITPAQQNWGLFANNIKSASNSAVINLTNTSQNLASGGLTLSYTVASDCVAFVTISLGVNSASDFEFRPEVRRDGTIIKLFTPAASLSGGRAHVRSFSWAVPLTAGSHTISAGVNLASSTSAAIGIEGATIAAIVLGEVTA